ncbi:sulfatase [Candidatus Fermentibacteria bacterium]|nr:sulfatase [Candidatus Fermentibacteria bacterium]
MNRILACAACLAAVLSAVSCRRGPDGPNVVLIILDTVRADHLSCYGYRRATTPFIDSLAGAGTLFLRCQSQSSWTLPAAASILTGLSPREHGAGFRGGAFYGVDPAIEYMPAAFHSAGYATAAFVNVVFLSEDFGFHRGFDHFDCRGFAGAGSDRRAAETTEAFLAWLDTSPGVPFFALVHFYDAHMKYEPPPPWDSMFTDSSYEGEYDSGWGGVQRLVAVNAGEEVIPPEGLENLIGLYDGEIAFTDAAVGVLLEGLRSRGLSSNTVVVVVADHGEEFMEHGFIEHGNNLFQTSVHVPLVISGPGFDKGVECDAPCSQMDIFPTLASVCGLETSGGLPGGDLRSAAGGGWIPASGMLWRADDMASVTGEGRKVIWIPGDSTAVVYDLEADPGEISPFPADEEDLSAVTAYWATPALGRPAQVTFRETVDRALRGLGYIR